ncbi:dihydropteroate synthase [Paenibacillus mesophilus]|uniref:dihydropteroate synthase n=1 Tax=Paenibacillus mesophilus TaxID=2582849 RepID=UPI00110ECD82|nr:dihydropteroate synthase [Paenibacillus mesophilus]TMV44316.1 dihydropteroate synthase [Paenibacillus mesophilus]
MLKCRNLELTIGERTLIMGILNVTPDSFSDGGQYVSVEKAVERSFAMVEEGADMIDVGGESTRPGFTKVTVQEELDRVVPVIRALVEAGLPVPISIDTYKAEVAKGALEAGAHIVNDIWGFKENDEIANVAAAYDCPVILMHNRRSADYGQYMTEVLEDLRESVEIARGAGIGDDRIILDPGIGFGKTYEHNLLLMNRLHQVAALGFPVLLGTSRKSMIRNTLGVTPEDALEGTAATVALGIAQGCAIMRVHDVKAMKRVAAMTDAMIRV